MKKINLGVIFDEKLFSGGGYQQEINAALLAARLPKDSVNVVFFTLFKESEVVLSEHGISSTLIKLSIFSRLRNFLRSGVKSPKIFKIFKIIERYTTFERVLIDHDIDLVYFLSPSYLANYLDELNFITTVWDLCHRDNPEFPEVRLNRETEKRELNLRKILVRATAILVDSELGHKNIVHRYGVDWERIHIMPFQGSVAIRNSVDSENIPKINVKEKYSMEFPYIFYPAQFWAHKNHFYLLKGLHLLEKKYGLIVGAIFSGGDQGNLNHIRKCAIKLNLNERVKFLGFVGNDDIPELYRQSLALVMPSYFGPTNLPPLEAFCLGVPVLYSKMKGFCEQVGDAGLLMDLTNPDSMAQHIYKLIQEPNLRKKLIINGHERLKHINSIDRNEVLKKIINDFRWRRMCWP